GADDHDIAVFGGAAADYVITRVSEEDVLARNAAIAERLAGFGLTDEGYALDRPVFRVRYVGTDGTLATDSHVQAEELPFEGSQGGGCTIGEVLDGFYLRLARGGMRYAAGRGGDARSNCVKGGDGDDHLQGGAGDDRLLGGAGDDVLAGGAGSDYLDGGEGSDTYLVGAADAGELETIEDSGTEGIDVVQITDGGELDLSQPDVSGVE